MSKVFRRTVKTHFRDCDPAGILFFANVFAWAHDSFEEFIEHAGIPWASWFSMESPYLIPIRQTRSEYFSPFFPGQTYEIAASVEHMGTSSFQMRYEFSQDGKQHALVEMTHVFVDKKTGSKTSIPETVQQKLKPFWRKHD